MVRGNIFQNVKNIREKNVSFHFGTCIVSYIFTSLYTNIKDTCQISLPLSNLFYISK